MAHLDEPQAPPEAGGGGPSSAAGEARTRARRYRLLPVIASIAAAAAIVLVFLMLKAVPGVRERFLARNPAPDARAVDTPAAEDRSATPADLVTVDAAPGSDRGRLVRAVTCAPDSGKQKGGTGWAYLSDGRGC